MRQNKMLQISKLNGRLHWLGVLLFGFPIAHAQAVSLSRASIRPNLVIGSISIAASPANLNFNLSAGADSDVQPLSVTTTISGISLLSSYNVTAYFVGTNALTSAYGDVLPSSAVLAQCSTCSLASYTPFIQSSSFSASSSLNLISGAALVTLISGTRTDTLNLKINLASMPQAAAGTYAGTLVLAATAF